MLSEFCIQFVNYQDNILDNIRVLEMSQQSSGLEVLVVTSRVLNRDLVC